MKKSLFMFLLLTICTMAEAQNATRLKTRFVQSQFDIKWSIPTSFTADAWSQNHFIYSTTDKPKGKVAAGYIYDLGATSTNGDCRLLYASLSQMALSYHGHVGNVYKSFVAHELYSAANNGLDIHEKEELTDELNKRICIYTGSQAKKEYNADSVYVVDFPNVSDKMAPGYNHCIGIYLCKTGYMPIIIKSLLNDNGYQNKDKYIKLTQKAVRFGKKGWTYNANKLMAAQKELQQALTE